MGPADRQLEASPLVSKAFWSPRKMAVIIAIFLVSPLLVRYAVKPAYHAWRQREAQELSRAAMAAIAAEDYADAARLVAKASGSLRSAPEIVRAQATLLSKVGADEQAISFWRTLESEGRATPEDLLEMGLSLARSGHFEEARKALGQLPTGMRQDYLGAELEATILRGEGQPTQADAVLRTACARDPERPECMLGLARFDLASPFDEVKQAALSDLWKLARGDSSSVVGAIDLLASHPGLTDGETEELLALITAHKKAAARHRLLVLTAYMRTHPEEKGRVISEETERHRGETLDKASEFLRWLDGLREHKLVLSLLSAEDAAKSPDLFVAYANALVGEKRWSELREMLKAGKKTALHPMDVALLNARCAHGLAESPSIVAGRLQEALHMVAAARSVEGAQKLADAAMAMGYDDVAMEAYRTLEHYPQHRAVILERMFQLEFKMRKTSAMLATSREILRERPNYEPMILTELYLRLLLGVEMETAAETIDELGIDRPRRRSAKRFLQAFAAMRRGDTSDALDYAEGVDPSTLVAGQRAVLSAIYRSAGDTRKAFELAEKVPDQLLLGEERHILAKSL